MLDDGHFNMILYRTIQRTAIFGTSALLADFWKLKPGNSVSSAQLKISIMVFI